MALSRYMNQEKTINFKLLNFIATQGASTRDSSKPKLETHLFEDVSTARTWIAAERWKIFICLNIHIYNKA